MKKLVTLMIGIAILVSSSAHPATADDTAKVSLLAVGKVSLLNGTFLGTAFVIGESRSIFMPAHVAKEDSLFFLPYKSESGSVIDRVLQIPGLDLAIYKLRGGKQLDSYPYGNFDRTLPGDPVHVIGMFGADTLYMQTGVVSAKGKARSSGQNVDFIDIKSEVLPGSSGSPVFNSSGQVIAMIVEGWQVHSLHTSGQLYKTARAYSIDILRVLEQDVIKASADDSTGGSEQLLLLDALGPR